MMTQVSPIDVNAACEYKTLTTSFKYLTTYLPFFELRDYRFLIRVAVKELVSNIIDYSSV